ncbi:MAG: MG2 domain-containing protein, partial [Bacteroidetes bacterium]|nr:MG2 domain-containing protein [Bacteroidota bacterium]
LLTQALSKYTRSLPETDAIKKLLATIKQPKLSIQTESVYLPNQPILSLVNYTNTPRVYFSIVSLNMNEWEKYSDNNKETDGALLKKVALQEKKWELPASSDRRNHSTEVMINPLSPGKYAIIASSMLDLNNNECVISVSTFQVSAIAALQQNNQWIAVNRSNGEPLANADFQFYSSSWSSKGKVYQRLQSAKGKADANGQFKLDNKIGNIGGVSIRSGQDELFVGDIYNIIEPSFRENAKELEANIEQYILLTDRSIYRPGQTVFWKAIKYLENKNSQSSKVAAEGTSLTLYLRDPNNQIIDSITGSLNSFGSFSGQFRLPRNRINGTFRLDVEGQRKHTVSIQVEEYKRPKFTIEWNKQKANYGMQDTLSVIGKAVAFGGYNVGKAIVRYQVIRQERFIPYYRSSGRNSMNRTEIVSGNMETDATGNFKITFKPVADPEDVSDENQFYTYEISATITDIGGETQIGNTSLPVCKRSVFANWQLPNILTEKEWKKAQLFSTNLSNEFTPTSLTVRVDALQAPDRLLRERYWALPDQYVMSEQEFKTNFPNDVYRNENKPANWPVLQAISTDNFISQPNGKNPVTEQKLSAGYYRITTTYFDSTSGKSIQDIQHTRLVQNNQQAATNAHFPYAFQANKEVFVGDTLQAFLFAGKSTLLHSFQLSPATDTIILEKKLIKEGIDPFSVKAAMPGTYQYHTCYINNNRVFEHTFEWTILPVPHPLTIKTTSFRDRLIPGKQEKWTLEIVDSANRQAPAELVSTLYDASLDQFRLHQWYLPKTQLPGIYSLSFGSDHNFSSKYSYAYYEPEIGEAYYPTPSSSRLADDAFELYNQNRDRRVNGQLRILPFLNRPPRRPLQAAMSVAYDQSPATYITLRETSSIKTTDDNSILTSNNPAEKKGFEFPAFEARKNLSETGFFLPHVYANEKGVYSIEFTVPESLTKWKWLNWAHTRDMSVGLLQKEVFTQKPLMVIPQLPRFLREGDQLELSAQIANPGDSELTGQVMLELIDGDTEKPVDGWFQNVFPVQYFTVAAGKTHPVKFPIQIPFGYNRPLLIRIKAFSGQFSDGEQQLLPVITQRTLVTESKSFWMKNDASLSLSFPTLLNNTSGTLTHESIQLEVATQPAWYIVKALPYLLENNNPTAEQVCNRLFANQLSFHILQQFPAIKKVIEQWKKDTTALQSKLSSSPQLQSLLQE